MLARENKAFHESDEGFTYIKQRNESMLSKKILEYLHGDPNKGKKEWNDKIKLHTKKKKVQKND
jgi:hypothetical protein